MALYFITVRNDDEVLRCVPVEMKTANLAELTLAVHGAIDAANNELHALAGRRRDLLDHRIEIADRVGRILFSMPLIPSFSFKPAKQLQ